MKIQLLVFNLFFASLLSAQTLDVQGVSIPPKCYGSSDGSIQLTVSGGTPPYSYAWSPPVTATGPNATGLAAGVYSVTVSDSAGATVASGFELMEPPELMIDSSSQVNPTCPGVANGQVVVIPKGGTPLAGNYFYFWKLPGGINQTGLGNGSTISNLEAGCYCLTITDNNNCFLTDSFCLEYSKMLQVALTVSPVTCPGGNDGCIEALASSTGEPLCQPWVFNWIGGGGPPVQTGPNTSQYCNLSAGNGVLVLQDACGCLLDTNFVITQPPPFSLNPVVVPETGSSMNGSISLDVSGGNGGPYFYSWTAPTIPKTSTITNLSMGTYGVTVTDAKGCQINATFFVDRILAAWEPGFSEIQIAPNPPGADGRFFLKNLPVEAGGKILVTDAVGRRVGIFEKKRGAAELTVSLEKAGSGMYLLFFQKNGAWAPLGKVAVSFP